MNIYQAYAALVELKLIKRNNLLITSSCFKDPLYKIHLMENVRCDSGQLWEGNVGEPSSLENRISECKIKCDGYTQCKFIIVNILNDWCRIHSSCDATTSTNSDSITLAKKGISLLVSIISQTDLNYFTNFKTYISKID